MTNLDDVEIKKSEGGDFDLIPEDIYEVMIKDMEALMLPNSFHGGKEELTLNVTFQIVDGEYEGRLLWRRINPTISIEKPSNLFKLVSAVEGKKLDGSFFDTFKLSTLLGRVLRVTVINKVSGDKTYANIESFMSSKVVKPSPAKKTEPAAPELDSAEAFDAFVGDDK